MKNFRIFVLPLIIVLAFCFNSCENEPVDTSFLTENSSEITSGNYIKVTKDGVIKQWSTVQAINVAVLNSFIITAADPSSAMNLTLFDVSKAGVYNLNWGEISCIYNEGTTIFGSDYSDFNTSIGNITITELNQTNKTIKGTFNFIGKNQSLTATKVFAKGEFFTTYTIQ